MLRTQKQIWRPVEQNRRPKYEFMQLDFLIFDKGTKNIWWRKDSLFNKYCWENWISACRKLKVGPCLSLYTISTQKPETLNLEQEKAGNTLEESGIDNDFLNRTQMTKQLRERIIKWNYKHWQVCEWKGMLIHCW
jgi:hypothetical protein